MKTSIPGRRFQHLRPVAFLAGLLLALAGAPQEAGAMWVGLTDAELQQQSVLVVDGEWVGEGAWPGRSDGARLGAIAVKATLQGKAEGNLVFVQRPPASRPVSSSDLSFRRGDRGLWFLKRAPGADAAGVFLVDHPQRFVREGPDSAAAIEAWRRRLNPPAGR